MKRFATILLICSLAFWAFACSSSEDSSEDSTQDNQATEDEEQYIEETPAYLLGGEPGEEEAGALSEDPDAVPILGYIPEGETLAGEPFNVIHGAAVWQPSDRRFLCGQATNVFVGEVIAESTTTPLEMDPDFEGVETPTDVPRSQFNVAVAQENSEDIPQVLGTLGAGSIVGTSGGRNLYRVNQVGGQLAPEDPVQLLEGDPLLVVGQTYLFSTAYDSGNGWYTILIQPYGDIKIESVSQRDRLIRDFKTACRYEKTAEDAMAEADDAHASLAEEDEYESEAEEE